MKRAIPDNPSPADRRLVARRIRLLPLMRRDGSGEIDWPVIAGKLADELRIVAARLADDPAATDADRERVARSRAVVRDYDTAARAERECVL